MAGSLVEQFDVSFLAGCCRLFIGVLPRVPRGRKGGSRPKAVTRRAVLSCNGAGQMITSVRSAAEALRGVAARGLHCGPGWTLLAMVTSGRCSRTTNWRMLLPGSITLVHVLHKWLFKP